MTSNVTSFDIKPIAIEEEMKRSYLDYAMSVIVARALPDVRDGLKPVHRRILYGMKEAGNDYNRPYRKSARVVGDVMGKYHPHGDSAIYDAMVRMAQEFSLRLPLIDGQGNFGSMDGDPPAAMRYTEARLSRPAHELLEDIDKETVQFQPNYDDSTAEPVVLPARFPNLLINGGNGIAVGMATNIPTHNLGEVIEACCALISHPDLTLNDLMNYIPGPDFPTGGLILGRNGIYEAYRTGRGSIIIRGKHHIEQGKADRQSVVITEIPYQVNKARMIERMAEMAKEKIIEGIADLRDESDRDGVRVVIELKKDAVADVVLNQLYKHTPLQNSFGINILALLHGRPEQLSLKQILQAFLDFREEIITKRTRFELSKVREKAHLLVGLAIAVANIDPIIALIRTSSDRSYAKEKLLAQSWPSKTVAALIAIVDITEQGISENDTYTLSETQANAILDLRLHRLTGLEREKIAQDLQDIAHTIQNLVSLLSDREKILALTLKELQDTKQLFSTPRRTSIEDTYSDVDIEDLIKKEDMVVTVSMEGYIKRVPLVTYRSQKRGGKGRSAMSTKEEDVVDDVFVANTHSTVLFFSSLGKVYQLKVYSLPMGTPQAKGRPMVNLLPLAEKETITTVMMLPEEVLEQLDIVFATSLGHVRRNRLSDFVSIRGNGKIAMKLDEREKLVAVKTCTDQEDILLSTRKGKCIRFPVNEIRVFAGRDSNGVRGIKLSKDDEVIAMAILKQGHFTTEERDQYLKQASKIRQEEADSEENSLTKSKLLPERFQALSLQEEFILTITENGYGKRSSSYEYRTTGRGGVGIDSIIVNQRNGWVVGSFPIHHNDQIILVSNQGQMIRCPVKDIRLAGRRTQGVIIFRLSENEKVVAVSRIPVGDDEEERIFYKLDE